MPKLKLFELESTVTWWVAAIDELGVLSLIRDEMEDRGHTELDIDDMLSDFEISRLPKYVAENIGIESPHDGEVRSLWHMFTYNKSECVLGTSLDSDAVDLDGVEELNFDLSD